MIQNNVNKGYDNLNLEFGNCKYQKETNIIQKKSKKKRKVFSISMVKNEADIIESFVRYHCCIFDGMVIIDSFSSDNTLKILNQLKAEGKPIYILQDSSTEFTQNQKMTKLLYYTIDKYNPDIVVPLDADEFLTVSNSKGDPLNILNRIPMNKVFHVKWRNYVPDSSDVIDEKFIPKRLKYARIDKYSFEKVIIPKAIARKYPLKLVQGNHTVKSISDSVMKKLYELEIAHFPVRSIKQVKSKILSAWINNLSRYNRDEKECWHWKNLFEKFKKGEDIDQNDLIQIAKDYCSFENYNNIKTIFKPIDLSFCQSIDIKYTEYEEINPLKNLLENCELLAKEYALLKKKYLESISSKDDKKL